MVLLSAKVRPLFSGGVSPPLVLPEPGRLYALGAGDEPLAAFGAHSLKVDVGELVRRNRAPALRAENVE